MNLEAYLEQLHSEGEHNSQGSFSLTLPQFLSRLSQTLLIDPNLAPLFLVAAAVQMGALQLEVQPLPKLINYRFDMAEPDLGREQNLLTEAGQESKVRWLLLAMAAQGQPTSLSCPLQGRQLLVGSQTCEVKPWKSSDQDPRPSIQVIPARGAPPVAQLLRRHCSLCPVPLLLMGKTLQNPLTEGYRDVPVAWSDQVPLLFRPPQPGQLDTGLALFLARTRAARPTWVAVVGGVSYPFLLPEARATVGVIWSTELKTDLGLSAIIRDKAWKRTVAEILRLTKGLLRSTGP